MLIFLYGEDTYRSRQKLEEIIVRHKAVHKSGLNLKYFDLQKSGWGDIKNVFQVSSMFKEKKLIILMNSFSDADFKEMFLSESKCFIDSEDIILFYEEGIPDKRTSLFKFLKQKARSQEFQPLSGTDLRNWIEQEFQKYQKKIDDQICQKLIDFIGDDLWRFSNEIKKIVNFKKDSEIKEKDIQLLIKPKIETDVFKTIDALALRDKRKALFLVHQHLEKGDSASYLFAMINYQFRNLLIIKSLIGQNIPYEAVLKKSGLHPFVVKKSHWQAQKFTEEELKKIYQKIFEVDLDIKTGQLTPQAALDLLIAGI